MSEQEIIRKYFGEPALYSIKLTEQEKINASKILTQRKTAKEINEIISRGNAALKKFQEKRSNVGQI